MAPYGNPSALQPYDIHPGLVGAPSFYVTGEDQLRLVSLNALTGVTLTVVGRILTCDGAIVPFVFTHAPNTDRTAKTSDFPLGEGWLLNVAVYASAATPLLGQTFAMLRVSRGGTGATQELATIAQGYVTSSQRLAWPGTPITTTLDKPGAIRSITGTNPAAAAEISETVPTGARWRLLAFSVALVNDANVANRQPTLTIDDGAIVVAQSPQKVTSPASQTTTYGWTDGLTIDSSILSTRGVAGLPANNRLLAGWRLKTVTSGIQAGDDYGAPQYVVEEWIEGA